MNFLCKIFNVKVTKRKNYIKNLISHTQVPKVLFNGENHFLYFHFKFAEIHYVCNFLDLLFS